jgi:hypothetical protein
MADSVEAWNRRADHIEDARHMVTGAAAGAKVMTDKENTNDRQGVALSDDFRGDDAHLVRCIKALISMNDAGALVPHGIGGHARSLLSAAAVRLSRASSSRAEVEREWKEGVDAIMGQAQVFASAWSLLGGRFDDGSAMETAEDEKGCLRMMVENALLAAAEAPKKEGE